MVLHTNPVLVAPSAGLDRLKEALKAAKVYEDAGSIVYDRDKLAPPGNPILIATGGWRKASWDAGRSA